MRRLMVIPLVGALTLILVAPSAGAVAATGSTLVVDRDRVECPTAAFTSIQDAVDAARPGDLIRVCPDTYPESVTIDKPLTVWGQPDSIEAIDCLAPATSESGDATGTPLVIVDPAAAGFTVAFALRADDIILAGLVVQGASVGIDAADRFSGYGIHHNLIQGNSLFGIDLGSDGTRESRVHHNCLRDNRYGLVSELDDDSLWSYPVIGDERAGWNARELRRARIDHNVTTRNGVGAEAAGPGRHDQVTLDHNLSQTDAIGIALQNSTGGTITANEVDQAGLDSVRLGGANTDLAVTDNLLTDGGIGIRFAATLFIDRFPTTNWDVQVVGNVVRHMQFSGINANPGTSTSPGDLHDSVVAGNTSSGNGRDGIVLFAGNSGNEVSGNVAENNGRNGVAAQLGATGNTFRDNRMFNNLGFDARDDNRAVNTWTANQCVTDWPAGSICGLS